MKFPFMLLKLFSQSSTIYLAFIALIFLSSKASAHVKWLTKPNVDNVVQVFSYAEMLTAAGLLVLLLAIAAYLHQYAVKQAKVFNYRTSNTLKPLQVSYYFLAIYFLGCALSGYILAPHIKANTGLVYFCVAIQALISVLLVLNRYTQLIAILMALLFVIAGLCDTSFLIEYVFLIGLAWIIYYRKKIPNNILLIALRLTLGISFVTLGFTEKLLYPELAINVLKQYPFNFMHSLMIDFTDLWFVLAAGTVEVLIGALFILGLLVRTTTLVLLTLMVASNSYFMMVGNYPLATLELIGHLPVFAAGTLLLFYCGEAKSESAEPVKGDASVQW